MRAPWAALGMAVFLGGPLAAQNRVLPAAPAAPSFSEVTDEAGRKVRVPQPVRRIVSLAPSLTETIYELGAQDRLVADTDYCDYPEEARSKAKVGGALNPSIEQIAALHPDLVLLTKGLNRYETVLALEQLEIPVYAVDPHSVEEMIASSKRLAEILGIPEAGRALSEDLEKRLEELRSRLAGLPAKRVLFVVWSEPLVSAGQKTFVADALRRAGAVSIVETEQDWPQISLEEAVRLHPEFIVFAAAHAQSGEKEFSALAERPVWREMEAVKSRKIVVVSEAVNRPAPRMVAAIEELARQLHPEAFSGDEKKAPANSPPARLANSFKGGGAG
ncbi:MAG: helical backbone metal receptor [Acidobacteriia bacterium]|nr:helical backbone metal receptor [Terriglobia bacterium]